MGNAPKAVQQPIPPTKPARSWREAMEEWRQKPKLFLSPKELALCRKDPTQAATLRGPQFVACLECGLLVELLEPHLRGRRHEMTLAQYHDPDHWPGAPTMSLKMEESRRRREKRTWTLSPEFRQKISLRLRGKARPTQQTVSETRLAELALEGKTFDEMGKALALPAKAVRGKNKLLERLGFPRRGGALGGYIFEHGRAVTGQYIRDILDDFGITQRELARALRIHYVWVGRLLHRRAQLPLRADTARKFVEYRCRANSALVVPIDARAAGLEQAKAIKGIRRQRYLLASECHAIREQHPVLHELLTELRNGLRDGEIKADGILSWICGKSRAETAGLPGLPQGSTKYRRLLFRWPVLREYLKQNDGVLFRLKPYEVAHDFQAFDYGTTRLSVEHCLSGELQPLDPARAGELLRFYAPAKTGAPAHLQGDTVERIRLAAAFHTCNWSIRKMARFLQPNQLNLAVAESNAYRFWSDHRARIKLEASRLSKKQAERLVEAAQNPLRHSPSEKSE